MAGVAVTMAAIGPVLPAASSATAAAAAAPSPSAAYVALQPCRLADTRTGVGVTEVAPQTLQIVGRDRCGIPAGATALAVTLTVADTAGAGYLSAWPANQGQPTASSLNFAARQVRANGAIVRVDGNGAFDVYTSVPADVVVDVVGAFVPATSARAGRFTAIAPTRLYDSRAAGARVAPGGTVDLGLPAGVPADATALAVNVTLTESVGAGFVTEYPAGGARPTASILNVDGANQTRAAAGILPVSAAGMTLFVSSGGHVIVDVVGWFTGPSAASSNSGLFTAYDPQRLLDTRGASPLGSGVPLFQNGGLELPAGGGGALAYNITTVDGDPGYVTAYPAGTPMPATSSVNSNGYGDVVANFGITQVSNRGLGVYAQSRTHVVVDLAGWFSGPAATATKGPPSNVDPGDSAPSPVTNQVTFSGCLHDGLGTINAKRAEGGLAPLGVSPGAEGFSCTWALRLAQAYQPGGSGSALVHSTDAERSAAAGCPTGENIAFSSGTSTGHLYEMWFQSAPHLANIVNRNYRNVGIGFVIRTEPNGSKTIWGVNDFTLC